MIVRAIGPSLGNAGVTGALQDPTLELHDSNGALIASNDNWRDTQEAEILTTGLQPTNDLESAIVATLPSSPSGIGYTAIVRGVNGNHRYRFRGILRSRPLTADGDCTSIPGKISKPGSQDKTAATPWIPALPD